MKKMNQLVFAAVILGITALSSCKKDVTPTATLTIMEPMAMDTVAIGDTVHMEGTVVGSGELHGYSLSLTNLSTGQIVYSGSTDVHQTSYAFDEHWINNVAGVSTMRLSLTVNLDHEGHTTTKSVEFMASN
jgi:hypothetical protein